MRSDRGVDKLMAGILHETVRPGARGPPAPRRHCRLKLLPRANAPAPSKHNTARGSHAHLLSVLSLRSLGGAAPWLHQGAGGQALTHEDPEAQARMRRVAGPGCRFPDSGGGWGGLLPQEGKGLCGAHQELDRTGATAILRQGDHVPGPATWHHPVGVLESPTRGRCRGRTPHPVSRQAFPHLASGDR